MWRKFEAKTDMLSGGPSLNFVVWNRVLCCPLFCVIPLVKKKSLLSFLNQMVCVCVCAHVHVCISKESSDVLG